MSSKLEYNTFVVSGETPQGEVTMVDVKTMMNKLGIVGYSSIGEPSPETHMLCLDEIKRIISARIEAASSRE